MAQINAVENPIINSPYDEPKNYWHIEEGKQPEKRVGRRPASYFFRVPDRASRGKRGKQQKELFEAEAKGEEYLLDLANLLPGNAVNQPDVTPSQGQRLAIG